MNPAHVAAGPVGFLESRTAHASPGRSAISTQAPECHLESVDNAGSSGKGCAT